MYFAYCLDSKFFLFISEERSSVISGLSLTKEITKYIVAGLFGNYYATDKSLTVII